jgi:exopolysaccharide/PEP-CTERM locus tyrosine autokinase
MAGSEPGWFRPELFEPASEALLVGTDGASDVRRYQPPMMSAASALPPGTAPADTGLPEAEVEANRPESAPGTAAAEDVAAQYVELNLERLGAIGMVVPNGASTPIAEEYRLIKRPLVQNMSGQAESTLEHPNLIMVTSALPGEGKTFTAINLAMSMVMEMDHTVLLVDADIPKPSLQRVFDIDVDRGLIDVLLGDADLSDVLLTTNVPKLRLLPAGRPHSHSVELLASEAMRNLLRHISERYPDRIVIFDCPPLLVTSEAGILADLMSQIVLVVEANETPQEAVKEALSQLDESKYVGLVLNKSEEAMRHFDRYRSQYDYRYGQ